MSFISMLGCALSGPSRGAISCRLPETRRISPALSQAPQHSQKNDVTAQKLRPCSKRDSVALIQAPELPQPEAASTKSPTASKTGATALAKTCPIKHCLLLAWLGRRIAAEGGEPSGIGKYTYSLRNYLYPPLGIEGTSNGYY